MEGDCLNPRLWKLWHRHRLADSFTRLPHGTIDEIELQTEGIPWFRHTLPRQAGEFRAVARETLDTWLAEEARRAGARFIEGETVRALRTDGALQTDHRTWPSHLVIAADGRNSLIAREAGLLPQNRGRCHRVGWQARLTGLLPSRTIRMNLFPEGYYGLVDLGGGQANLSMVLDTRAETETSPERILRRYLPEAAARIASLQSIAPIFRPPATAVTAHRGTSIWLIGDAARVVEPFTGEGIHLALASAGLCDWRRGGVDGPHSPCPRPRHAPRRRLASPQPRPPRLSRRQALSVRLESSPPCANRPSSPFSSSSSST